MAQNHPRFSQQEQCSPFNLDIFASPDSITMPSPGRPADASVLPFAQYASSLSAQGQHSFSQNQGLDPINQFMFDRGPWNPIQMTAPSPSVGVQFNQGLPSFAGHRSVPPSEADTVSQSIGGILTDSGYGSNARQSVGNPSVYGELDPIVIARLQAMGQDDVSLKGDAQKREARGPRPIPGTSNGKGLICPECEEPVKTPSELKQFTYRYVKHRILDTTPILTRMFCRILSPHLATLGPPETAVSEAPMVPSPDSTSQPSWGEIDQGHVAPASLINGHPGLAQASNMAYSRPLSLQERAGASSSAVEPHYSSQDSAGPNQPTRFFERFDAQTSSPVGAVRLETGNTQGILQEDAQLEAGRVEYTAPEEMDVDNPTEESASEDGQHDTESEGDEPPCGTTDFETNIPRDAGAQYDEEDEVQIKLSPSQVQLGADTPRPTELDDDEMSAVLQSLINKGKLDEMLKKLGYSAVEEANIKDQKPAIASSTASETGRINKCNECQKTFTRPSELRKHMKRHAKPYACTFAKCCKKFGSKNDWKRHENSQHFQLEIWRCAEQTADRPDQQECGKVCHRRESLKSHLEKDHGMYGQAMLDKKLSDCRLGRNFESRFWCGFCQKTIEPTGKGGPAHSERFDHIDDHFNGKNGLPKADINNWKHIDTDPLDTPASSPTKSKRAGLSASRAGKSRKRVHGGTDDSLPRGKRFKDGNGKVWFWFCCRCGDYWKMRTTDSCINDGCNHAFCDKCETFAEEEDMGEADVPNPAQGVGKDGLMT
ncbi:hypothetical protein F5144DRAFT_588478 [Chaetomium tenue]|uniref:Uncharacterized protein n=1 Tax=Chaetomium tenue TaxID=1854479 RepID=A0ACB7PR78_9PEZI|nr:hypothetical protein F5144DRAFT_588478 [Chaetomium globosum]